MDAVLGFDAAWAYSPQGKTKLVTSEAEWVALMGEGWGDSPAAFGIETHPTNPAHDVSMGAGAVLQQLGVPSPFSPSQNWDEMMAMLQQMQTLLDGQATVLAEVMDRLELVEAEAFAREVPPAPAKGGKQ